MYLQRALHSVCKCIARAPDTLETANNVCSANIAPVKNTPDDTDALLMRVFISNAIFVLQSSAESILSDQ